MPILSLTDYKARRGITGSARDAQLTPALAAAEDTVNRECGRDFSAAQVTETRRYQYNGSGLVQTDDFTTLIGVSVNGGIQSLEYCLPGPATPPGDPNFWIRLAGRGPSPQMGFMWNADVLALEGRQPGASFAEVTAVWGWPAVPESVKQAVAWLATEMAADSGDSDGKDVSSESQGEVTYVYNNSGDDATTKAQPELPPRIRQLLHPFIRTRF